MKYQKEELGKKSIYDSNKKNKVPRNKVNQGGKRPVLRKLQNTEYVKKDTNSGSIYCIHVLEELTSLKCPYYPKKSIGSIQFLLNTNGIFHRSRTNISKIYVEPLTTPNSHGNFEKEEQSRRDRNTQYQAISQGHFNHNSLVLP